MRIFIIIFTIVLSLSFACKTKPKSETVKKSTESVSTIPKTAGKISHQYRETGCSTVIIVENKDGVLTLIPKDPLPDKIDVDGLAVTFEYRLLRMPNPKGCNVGIPAEITNISKK